MSEFVRENKVARCCNTVFFSHIYRQCVSDDANLTHSFICIVEIEMKNVLITASLVNVLTKLTGWWLELGWDGEWCT